MEEDKKNLIEKDIWWKPAMEIFSQVSVWIVVPIILAFIFGKMLDTYYGTEPMIFLSFVLLGFLFSCFGIMRVVRKYIKEIEELAIKKTEVK